MFMKKVRPKMNYETSGLKLMILKKKKIGSKENKFSANIRKSVQNLHRSILNDLSFQNILSVFYVFPVYFIKKAVSMIYYTKWQSYFTDKSFGNTDIKHVMTVL